MTHTITHLFASFFLFSLRALRAPFPFACHFPALLFGIVANSSEANTSKSSAELDSLELDSEINQSPSANAIDFGDAALAQLAREQRATLATEKSKLAELDDLSAAVRASSDRSAKLQAAAEGAQRKYEEAARLMRNETDEEKEENSKNEMRNEKKKDNKNVNASIAAANFAEKLGGFNDGGGVTPDSEADDDSDGDDGDGDDGDKMKKDEKEKNDDRSPWMPDTTSGEKTENEKDPGDETTGLSGRRGQAGLDGARGPLGRRGLDGKHWTANSIVNDVPSFAVGTCWISANVISVLAACAYVLRYGGYGGGTSAAKSRDEVRASLVENRRS